VPLCRAGISGCLVPGAVVCHNDILCGYLPWRQAVERQKTGALRDSDVSGLRGGRTDYHPFPGCVGQNEQRRQRRVCLFKPVWKAGTEYSSADESVLLRREYPVSDVFLPHDDFHGMYGSGKGQEASASSPGIFSCLRRSVRRSLPETEASRVRAGDLFSLNRQSFAPLYCFLFCRSDIIL